MSRNCRIGRSFRIIELLYMPIIDHYSMYISNRTNWATVIRLSKAEADRIVADLKGEFSVAVIDGEPSNWGTYKFSEHYKSLKVF